MEKKLKALFDYQRFENNARLEKLIGETESRYGQQLSDDELGMVNAAGEFTMPGGAVSNNSANAPSGEKTTGSVADDPSGYQISERMR